MSELNTLPLRIKCDPLLIVRLGFIICQNCFSSTPRVSHNMAIFSFSLSTVKFLSACLYSAFFVVAIMEIAYTISRLILTFPLIECSIEFPFDVLKPLRKPRHSLVLFQLRLRVRFINCHVAFKTDQIILFGSSKLWLEWRSLLKSLRAMLSGSV